MFQTLLSPFKSMIDNAIFKSCERKKSFFSAVSIYGLLFLRGFSRLFEKSVPGAQIAPTAWGILHLVVSLNVAIALAVPLEIFGNLIKYSIDDNAYHSRFSNSNFFLKPCGRNSQSLNAIKHRSSGPESNCYSLLVV